MVIKQFLSTTQERSCLFTDPLNKLIFGQMPIQREREKNILLNIKKYILK